MKVTQPKVPFCQSCGMPMGRPEDFGANDDGLKNNDYCHFCFKEGKFTEPNITLDKMINKVTDFLVQLRHMPEVEAGQLAQSFIPKLKRWRG